MLPDKETSVFLYDKYFNKSQKYLEQILTTVTDSVMLLPRDDSTKVAGAGPGLAKPSAEAKEQTMKVGREKAFDGSAKQAGIEK